MKSLTLNFLFNLFNKELKAFYGKPELKDELISEIKNHMEMGEYRQGDYWDGKKGCAIGCLAPDVLGRHYFLAEKYGISVIVFHIIENIFEGLSFEESKLWSLRIFSAIKVGQDLSQVWPKFGSWMLVDEVHGLISLFEDEKSKENIKIIADSVLTGTEDSDIAKNAVREANAIQVGKVREAQALWEVWAVRSPQALRTALALQDPPVSLVSLVSLALGSLQAVWKDTRPTQETAKIQSDKLVEIVKKYQYD